MIGSLAFAGLTIALGLIAGAVINALADDLPYTLRVRLPHYPDGTPRDREAWLGVLAFIRRKRWSPNAHAIPHEPPPPDASAPETTTKALEDGLESAPESEEAPNVPARLSWRYPLTELFTVMLFLCVAADSGLTPRAFFMMGSVAILVLITVIDLEHRMILYAVMLPAGLYAIFGALVLGPALYPRLLFQDYLIGGAVGGGLFSVLYLGGMLFSAVMANARGETLEEVAFGFGDVLLATLSGLMLGWQALLFAVMIAVFAGGAGALLYLLVQALVKRDYEVFTALPYGQYIVFGTLVMMLWRAPLINYLQR